MAGQKRKRRPVQPAKTPPSTPDTQAEETQAVSSGHQRFTFWDYLFVNLFFWVFCWLQRTVAAYLNQDDMGLNFFFYTLAAGFSLVSVVAFIHDWLSGEVVNESDV